MKAFPNYTYNAVHIQDLYNAEKALFGMTIEGKIITPNEFWLIHYKPWIDITTGIFYLCWIPVPLAFAFYLFVKHKQLFLHFSLTFVLVNFIGFVLYYLYPAAPPWYMQQFGTDFIPGTKGNTAGLSRFDSITGLNVFHNLYSKSSNVFAAMPSLHSAYPLVVVYFGFQKKVKPLTTVLFATVMLGIWFAAIYTSHHYVLDVLAGILVAALGIFIFQKILLKASWFRNFLQSFLERLV
jgi:membrane-associated phospholipid phosphatase